MTVNETGARIESTGLASKIAAIEAARVQAVERLHNAVLEGSEQEILDAADEVRRRGASAPGLAWELVYAVETGVALMSALREALASGDDATIARAWSRASSICPAALTEEQERAGRAAFSRWGRLLRQQRRSGGRGR
jgi:hypothetical protein